MNAIRLATTDDAEQILSIYAPFCVDENPVSFEVVPPTLAEMSDRISKILEQYPWLVYTTKDIVLGYAYACTHKQRAAYAWSVDTAVYNHPDARRAGIGKALYTALFAILRRQGYINAYAGVTLPNPGSIGLHTAMGFTPVGVYHKVGYISGAWQDVGWFELELQPHIEQPPVPRPLSVIMQSPEFNRALKIV